MYINKIYRKNQKDFFLDYLYPINFTKPISILFGENGVGKSTIMEALAVHLGCPAEGGSKNFNFFPEYTFTVCGAKHGGVYSPKVCHNCYNKGLKKDNVIRP